MATPLLSEQEVINGFHAFLTSALKHAKAERLLSDDLLASAEADLMICGPALCLYFAALRSNTSPPGVPIPRPRGSDPSEPQKRLTAATCPPGFLPFFDLWARAVPRIQSLAAEHTYDLACIICGKQPITLPIELPSPFPDSPSADQTALAKVHAIAADLRAVAIEISQRRSFQIRYTEDLQAALNLGDPTSPAGSRGPAVTAKFVPPPSYDEAPPSPSPSTGGGKEYDELRRGPVSARPQSPAYGDTLGVPGSPTSPSSSSRTHSRQSSTERRYAALPPVPSGVENEPAFVGGFVSPSSPRSPVSSGGGFGSGPGQGSSGWAPLRVPQRSSTPGPARTGTPAGGHRATQSAQLSVPGPSNIPARPASPSLLTANDPSIVIIRETLYAGLGDALAEAPKLRDLLVEDPPRAYFASVSLAILNVSLTSITPRGSVRAVLGQELTLEDCPAPLRPLMMELASIGEAAKELSEEDDRRAMHLAERGLDIPEPRIDRLKRTLRTGVAEQRLEERAVRRNTRRERGRSPAPGSRSDEDSDEGRRSPSSSTVRFANRINELALRMTALPAFRERQQEVFAILKGVS
ncbi:hypothetical protein RhiJN_17344 [Ceratobasidium sp. AG-Ba]|nr:hypothetical protein RhiJN_17344 [Ceratobasidium sp. AG-Ba]